MGGSCTGMLMFINPQGTHLYTMCTVSMNNIFAWWYHMSVTEGVEHLLPVAYAIDLYLIATWVHGKTRRLSAVGENIRCKRVSGSFGFPVVRSGNISGVHGECC